MQKVFFLKSEVQKLFTTRRGQIKYIQVKERPNTTLLGRESKQDNKRSLLYCHNENTVDGF